MRTMAHQLSTEFSFLVRITKEKNRLAYANLHLHTSYIIVVYAIFKP